MNELIFKNLSRFPLMMKNERIPELSPYIDLPHKNK